MLRCPQRSPHCPIAPRSEQGCSTSEDVGRACRSAEAARYLPRSVGPRWQEKPRRWASAGEQRLWHHESHQSAGRSRAAPDEPTQLLAFAEYLRGRVVVRHAPTNDGPDKAPRLVVDRDDEFTRHDTVAKGNDTRALFESHVGDEAGHEARVERADVADGRPGVLGTGVDLDFLADGGHGQRLRAGDRRRLGESRGSTSRQSPAARLKTACLQWW
jgi:hypothetical protein